jgi:hypothetical protein
MLFLQVCKPTLQSDKSLQHEQQQQQYCLFIDLFILLIYLFALFINYLFAQFAML